MCCDTDGKHTSLSEKGEYTFFKFILESYSQVTFEKDPSTLKMIKFAVLELHYGSTLTGKSLDIQSNEIILHPGSTLKLQGGGYTSEQGPGAGSMVGYSVQNE